VPYRHRAIPPGPQGPGFSRFLMKFFCNIPNVCLPPAGDDLPSHVDQQLRLAFEQNLKPLDLPYGTESLVVDLTPDMEICVKKKASELALVPGRVVGGLLYALHCTKERTNTSHIAPNSAFDSPSPQPPFPKTVNPVLNGLRDIQAQCLQEAAPFLAKGLIVASECGTGTGKARLAAHAASYMLALRDAGLTPKLPDIDVERATDGDLPLFIRQFGRRTQESLFSESSGQKPTGKAVIVCAPTIDNMAHLVREWLAVQHHFANQPARKVAVVLGRGQFVSPSALTRLLDEMPVVPLDIQEWIDSGMPAGLTPSTRAIVTTDPRIHGLMSDFDFLAVNSELPDMDVAQDTDSPRDEAFLYEALIESAQDADVVFTTQAMLCMENLHLAFGQNQTRQVLPASIGFIVDEAHQLEATQANIASVDISFQKLRSILNSPDWGSTKRSTHAKAAAKLMRKVAATLSEIPDGTMFPIASSEDVSVRAAWQQSKLILVELNQALGKLIKSSKFDSGDWLSPSQSRSAVYLKRCMAALEKLSDDSRGIVSFSPVRRSVQLSVGPSSVGRYLYARWSVSPMVMLLSATLLHIGARGHSTIMLRKDLTIPANRMEMTDPIHPLWITSSPRVIMPSTDQWARFIPPTIESLSNKDQAFEAWANSCAQSIELAAADSAGGILVLCSGYDRLNAVADALQRDHDALSPRLIVQSPAKRVVSCSAHFKNMARLGQRPIWLATGAAGTGLDLSDETVLDVDACQDLLLTDLVILNLPFGLERSVNHRAKVSRIGFSIEAIGAQRRFRQWLGRLIRRPGLVHRRIWILDGRLQQPSSANLTSDFRRILSGYHRQPFQLS